MFLRFSIAADKEPAVVGDKPLGADALQDKGKEGG